MKKDNLVIYEGMEYLLDQLLKSDDLESNIQCLRTKENEHIFRIKSNNKVIARSPKFASAEERDRKLEAFLPALQNEV